MKLRVFFKKEFKDGYFINPNCKITDIYNYYHFFGGYKREKFIVIINLQGTNMKKRLSYDKEFDEAKINKSSKFKIYSIIEAWKNYNNYLKNIEDLKSKNIKEKDILF